MSKRTSAVLMQAVIAWSCVMPAFAQGALPQASQKQALDFIEHHSCAADPSSLPPTNLLLAQADAMPSAAPSPALSPVSSPSQPAEEATFMPVRSGSQGILIPPAPYSSGPSVTPPPIPTSTPAPVPSLGPVYLQRNTESPQPITPKGASPEPARSATPVPKGVPTLGPNQFAILADSLEGSTEPDVPGDAVGNVHLYYGQGLIVGDRAHYNGKRTVILSGTNPYVINQAKDAILYADEISFDTVTQRATLIGGRGATTQHIEHGELYYSAKTLNSDQSTIHGDHASFTTCLNSHRGYHIEARSIDVDDKRMIARRAVVFLGPAAIFFLPLLIIPLVHEPGFRHHASVIPQIGYDDADGFYVRAQLGFGTTPYYNGYYRVDYFTKRGLGLGYIATIARRDGKRIIDVNGYTIADRTTRSRQSNLNINDKENFSRNFRGDFSVVYNSNFGPNITLPANLDITGNLTANSARANENLTFNRNTQGALSDQTSIAYTDQLQITSALREALNIGYSKTVVSGSPEDDTLHINTQTSYTTKSADYLFTVNKTDATQPQQVGYDSVPELQINPHINIHNFRYPFQTQFTYGYYTEPQRSFSTERADMMFNWPIFFKVFHSSDFSETINVHQDLYGTGDAKAVVQENTALTTPIGNHIVNAITYNDSYPMGPANQPFQLLDNLPGAYKQAQDTLRFFNRDIYALSLASSTGFNRQAQPISYQLNVHPSRRAFLMFGGSWVPGSGNGFNTTNVQASTGLGRNADLQFTTNVDWKNKMRLENKNLYYRITIGDCYQVTASYNQDAKQVNLAFNLLAFPSSAAGFGIGGQTASGLNSILPQSLTY
jgi:hypothetical protein